MRAFFIGVILAADNFIFRFKEQVIPASDFWLCVFTVVLSLTWILPNHYPPWGSFHSDALIAVSFLVMSAFLTIRTNRPVQLNFLTLIIASLILVLCLQLAFGIFSFNGQFWISFAYLLGFFLAIVTGQEWLESYEKLSIALFAAFGLSAVFSVNLQLQTWLKLIDTGIFDLWSMGLSGERPYANLGQPNQLGTLLLWGLLASGWAFINLKIRGSVAILMACFLLVGIALTQSRTAWLGLTFIVATTWFWKRLWPSKRAPWVVTALFIFFWFCPSLLKSLEEILFLSTGATFFRGELQGDLRLTAWRLFINAALERPWFGYGLTEVGQAQLAVSADFSPLFSTFGHSHNLFLDLVLWLGIPLGLLFSGVLIWWFLSCIKLVSNPKDAILLMLLGVIGIHAMLELPLHYAYFLLPTGLVMGVLNQRLGIKPVLIIPRWTLVVVWVAAALMLTGIIRDYFRIEASFQAARFELARIGTLPVGEPPDVLLLTQLRERITYMRYEAKSGMTPEELDWVDKVVKAYPGGGMAYKAAKAFALNNRPEEAQEWLKKICKISSPEECDLIKRVWTQDAVSNPLIAAIPWPE